MSNLMLRVTGEQKKKPMKKCDTGFEDLRTIMDNLNIDCKCKRLEKLKQASSIEEQLNILRGLIKDNLAYRGRLSDSQADLLEIIIEIYLTVELKNPLKSALVRLLIGLPQVDEIEYIMVNLLCRRFQSDESSINVLNSYVSSLSGCFENFPLAISAVSRCKEEALAFLDNALMIYWNELREQGPPAKKLVAITGIHNAVRCAMTLIQKCSPGIRESFYDLCINLLNEEQLPLDTRSTSGMLCVICAKVSQGQDGWLKLLLDCHSLGEDISTLCVCTGILNTFFPKEMASNIFFEGKEIQLFFFLFNIIMDMGERNAADSNLILGVSRGVLILSRSLLSCSKLLTLSVLQRILSYIWTHLEHYMDAVRHLASSTLANIVILGGNYKEANLFDIIFEALDEMPGYRRSKFIALCALIGHVPIKNIMVKCPNLVDTLLNSIYDSSGATHAISSLESLMTQHYKEVDNHKKWINIWVDPLLSMMKNKPNSAFEQVLGKVVKLHTPVIRYVLKSECHGVDGNMNIVLTCLRVGRKCGSLKVSNNEKWKGLVDYSVLQDCLCHINSEVRLACLALISESQKTTESFTKEELELIKKFLIYNVNNESPAERQKSLSLFKKIMARLKDSEYALNRIVQNNLNRPPNAQPKDTSKESKLLNDYTNFLSWLMSFCIDSLFPGASFTRRCMVLNMLTVSMELGFWKNEFHTPQNGGVLLSCLSDTYEENKALARSLLLGMPPNILSFDDPSHVEKYIYECILLASSIKPPDCITAAYSLSVLTDFSSTKTIIRNMVNKYEDLAQFFLEQELNEEAIFSALCLLLRQLRNELSLAQISLLKAASGGPMYGQLFVIRHLLQRVNLKTVDGDSGWQVFIRNLVATAFDCNKVVACIVNSTSPEGHLPMDFDYDLSSIDGNEEKPKVTAQMVLLCSWRTVKEVSLLLGELAEKAPIEHSECAIAGLMSQEQVLAIGDHLTTLLAETKHRGAFEQAYVGFCKLTSMLWRFPSGNLHELPSKWLKETLNEITNNGKLCATRRSAGIPFMIQGLVCTELEVGGGKSFHSSMVTLLELGSNQMCSTETRTHAMNILRSLFRNSQLGEMVSPYVPQGISLAIQGFTGKTWSERNSATLLLSALMTRVFGVPRSASETLSWRNKMTGRIFFQRYPSLYGVLLKHLESVSESYVHGDLYPVLLILGRLYPSSLEGTDSNLQLSKYIPYVDKCGGSSILKTRSLAASAMVALITPNIFVGHLINVFHNISSSTSENLIHGLLLQVFHLLKCGTEKNEEISLLIQENVQSWCDLILLLLQAKHSFVTKEACINIASQLATNYYDNVLFSTWSDIEITLKKDLFSSENINCYSSYGIHEYLTNGTLCLLLLQAKRNSCGDLIESLEKLFLHNSYEVYNTILLFVQCLLTVEADKVDRDRSDILKSFSTDLISELTINIKKNNVFCELLVQRTLLSNHHEDRIKLLSTLKDLPLFFDILSHKVDSVIMFFQHICEVEHELIAAISLQCISAYFSIKGTNIELSDKELVVICDLLEEFTLASSDSECRQAATQIIVKNVSTLAKFAQHINALRLWTIIVNLLCDDEIEIRDMASSIIGKCLIPSRALEICFEQFMTSNLTPDIKMIALIGWALGDFSQEIDLLNDQEDRVFDKGEMNIYQEDIIVNRLAVHHLKNVSAENRHLFASEVSDSLSLWLASNCSLSCDKGMSILDFVNSCKNLIMGSKDLSFVTCPYFKTSNRHYMLNEIKLNNILSVIG